MKKFVLLIFGLLFTTTFFGQPNSFEWTKQSSVFPNGVSNQVAYINLGDIQLWGWIEITLTGGYHYQNTVGKYTKRYEIGKNIGNGHFYQNSETPVAFGEVATQWKLGELQKDINNNLIVPIYHLVSTGNSIIVNIKGVVAPTVPDTSLFQITAPMNLNNSEARDIAHTKNKFAVGSTLSVGTLIVDTGDVLTVAGRIGAREVKVTIDAGADFVFDKDYKLPSLEAIEAFIKKNRHLPGIDSEKEMQENGLLLAGMNIKLLQKIEELTLYTIEQEKKLESQETQIKEQSKNNIELNNRLLKLEQLLSNQQQTTNN